jgi:hypothetical protein
LSATITITLAVLAVYVIIPQLVDRLVRRELLGFSGYNVSYSRVNVSLLRGCYQLEDIVIFKKSVGQRAPFFQAKKIEFGISKCLFNNGRLAGKITAFAPRVNFVETGVSDQSQDDISHPWKTIGRKLMLFPLHEIQIINGKITYAEHISSPYISLEMGNININVRDVDANADPFAENQLVAHAEGDARINQGKLNFSIEFDPSAKEPVFHLKARLEDLDLAYLSDYLKVHGNYAIEKGLFSMVTQASGDEANISGFVKPLMETIQLASPVTTGSNDVLEGSPFAKPYPQMSFRNELDFLEPSLWTAVVFTLRSAFFEALMPVIRAIDSGEGHQGRHPVRPLIPKSLHSS